MVRILIIEDDEEMRSLLTDFLEGEGFETDSVSNGFDALRMLSKNRFDLVITDLGMPGLTGLDILPTIRRLRPGTPIVVMSAYGSGDLRRRSIERGASIYLEKPIHLTELRTVLREMVFGKSLRQTGSTTSPTRE